MWLVFLYGPPAVGKLTVGRELAKLTGFRLFHNHLTVDLLESVFEFGSPPFVMLREEIWLSVFRQAALNKSSLIFTFAPEDTVCPSFADSVVRTIQERGGSALFVELTCAEEELERRMEDPSRVRFGKLRSLDTYRELRDSGRLEYPYLPKPAVSIDTGSSSPLEVARQITDWLAIT